MKKEFWETLSPTDAQSEHLLQRIREKADSPLRPHRRPLRIAAVIAAVLVMTTVAGVVAAPAMIRYFVPHLGMVEVPESTENTHSAETEEPLPYLFLRNVTGKVSGNTYTVGYIFGDTAVLHLTTPIFEEYTEEYRKYLASPYTVKDREIFYQKAMEQLTVLNSETVTVEPSPVGTPDGIFAECVVTFTGLSRSVLTDGLSFMGDTLYFTAPGKEYRSFEQEFGGITVSLIPLSEDNTVFLWTLKADESRFYSVTWRYSDFELNIMNRGSFFRFVDAEGKQYNAKIKKNLLYLDTDPSAPIVSLQANRLDFRLTLLSEEYTIANPFLAGENTSVQIALPLLNGETVTVTASYEGPGEDARFPDGQLTLTGETVTAEDGAVRYSLIPGTDREYSDLLKAYREKEDNNISISMSGVSRRVPYFPELGETLTIHMSLADAVYSFPWNFTFSD